MMCITKRSISLNIVLLLSCLLTLLILGCPSKKQEQKSETPDSNTPAYKTETPQSQPAAVNEPAKQVTPREVIESLKPRLEAKKRRVDSPAIPVLPEPVAPQELIKQTAATLDGNDPEMRLEMMESLANEELTDPAALPVIAKGLKDPDEQVREAAVRALSFIDTPKADQMLINALGDTNEDVRRTALDAATEREDKIRWDILRAAIASPYQEVKEDAVANLIGLSTHNTIDILISGLKDPDADFRAEVNSALNLLISHEFNSYDEAVKWWNENKKNYDEELFEKEAEQ